jgi:hypothetical protein
MNRGFHPANRPRKLRLLFQPSFNFNRQAKYNCRAKGVIDMPTMTAENVLRLIDQLPLAEQAKLDQLMEQRTAAQSQQKPKNGMSPDHQPTGSPAQPLQPVPMPDGTRERQWLADHKREYANQWVALDGDRLIAASPNHDEVWAAAEADGAYLPLITFIEDPDHITHILWP